MALLFPIPFPESALSLFLLLLLVSFSSSSTIRLPSEADPCGGSRRPNSCPVNCFRADPVCGEDGVTYWCGCADAHCAGVKVAKIGFCEVGNNGGHGSLPGQALLLLHMVWLIILGFSVLFGLI
ncbi:hypothetical protein PTKIN_Ptkin04bG0159400 [Pterospermum kingtungense]